MLWPTLPDSVFLRIIRITAIINPINFRQHRFVEMEDVYKNPHKKFRLKISHERTINGYDEVDEPILCNNYLRQILTMSTGFNGSDDMGFQILPQ
jgi:hypothetical protein